MKIRRRRFAALVAANQPLSRPAPGKCNYPTKDGKDFCKRNAGHLTAHPGSGYCQRHDVSAYDPIHRYRNIKNKTVRQKMEKLSAQERDIFDLIPEVQLLRTLMIDYVDRWYEFQKELHAWYHDGKRKPKTALDITEVTGMIEGVTRIIERKHRIEAKEAISLETFRRVTEAMGISVARHVRDSRVLNAIEADWQAMSLDAKATTGMSVPLPPDRQLTDGTDNE